MSTTPLAEAEPNSLQELFDRDPLKLSRDDIEAIVTELRAQRERFVKAEAKPKKQAAPASLSLEDLGL